MAIEMAVIMAMIVMIVMVAIKARTLLASTITIIVATIKNSSSYLMLLVNVTVNILLYKY